MASSRRVLCVSTAWYRWMWQWLGAIFIATVDQAVKLVVLIVRPHISVVPWVLAARFGTNTGAAFELFEAIPRALTLLGGVVFLELLRYFPRALRVGNPWELTPLSLLVEGAMGNLMERIQRGYVVDDLEVFIGCDHGPTFNFADVTITFGVAMRACLVIGRDEGGRLRNQASSEDPT